MSIHRRSVRLTALAVTGLGLSFAVAPSTASAAPREPGCVQQIVESEVNGVVQTAVKCLLGSGDTTASSTIPAIRQPDPTTTVAPAPTPTAAPTPGPSPAPTAAPAPAPAPAASKAVAKSSKKSSGASASATAAAPAAAAPAAAPAELAAVDTAATNLPGVRSDDGGINWALLALILFAGVAAIIAAGGAINRHVRMVRELKTAAGPRFRG